MKKIIIPGIFALSFQIFVKAQCGIGVARQIKKNVDKGIYLMHESYNNKRDKPFTVVFNKGTTYGIYLLNPSNTLPSLTLINKKSGKAVSFENKDFDEENKRILYIFTIPESGVYKVKLDFGTEKKSCVLFVLTFIKKQNVKFLHPDLFIHK